MEPSTVGQVVLADLVRVGERGEVRLVVPAAEEQAADDLGRRSPDVRRHQPPRLTRRQHSDDRRRSSVGRGIRHVTQPRHQPQGEDAEQEGASGRMRTLVGRHRRRSRAREDDGHQAQQHAPPRPPPARRATGPTAARSTSMTSDGDEARPGGSSHSAAIVRARGGRQREQVPVHAHRSNCMSDVDGGGLHGADGSGRALHVHAVLRDRRPARRGRDLHREHRVVPERLRLGLQAVGELAVARAP